MIKKFETFTIGDLDEYDKSDLDELLAIYQGYYEFYEDKDDEIEQEIKFTINRFKKEIPIFDKIHVQLVKKFTGKKKKDFLGMYIHESVLKIPVVLLSVDCIKDAYNERHDLDVIIRSTIYHELGHAMVDLDNQIEFIKGQNVLQFENEEEYVEDFAFNFDMFGNVPEEILELIKLYKEYKS